MIAFLPLALRFGPYLLAAVIGASAAYPLGKSIGHRSGVSDGRAALTLELAEQAADRVRKANEAESHLRDCQPQPACRLQHDPNRRD